MASAGKILITPKGEWNSGTEYEVLDLVRHNGIPWLAKETVQGIEPKDSNDRYWFKLLDVDELINNKISQYMTEKGL